MEEKPNIFSYPFFRQFHMFFPIDFASFGECLWVINVEANPAQCRTAITIILFFVVCLRNSLMSFCIRLQAALGANKRGPDRWHLAAAAAVTSSQHGLKYMHATNKSRPFITGSWFPVASKRFWRMDNVPPWPLVLSPFGVSCECQTELYYRTAWSEGGVEIMFSTYYFLCRQTINSYYVQVSTDTINTYRYYCTSKHYCSFHLQAPHDRLLTVDTISTK